MQAVDKGAPSSVEEESQIGLLIHLLADRSIQRSPSHKGQEGCVKAIVRIAVLKAQKLSLTIFRLQPKVLD